MFRFACPLKNECGRLLTATAKGGRGVEEKLFKALLKLRQACCHPCIGSGGLGGSSGGQRLGGGSLWGSSGSSSRGSQRWLLTMDQVLDRHVAQMPVQYVVWVRRSTTRNRNSSSHTYTNASIIEILPRKDQSIRVLYLYSIIALIV